MLNTAEADLQFPPDFIFGAATAAYQIEGAVHEGGRGQSNWDVFSRTPGKIANGDTGDVAADHYHHLEEDLDLIAGLGLDAYRFSIAWSRIQPSGRGEANPEGISFYRRLIDGLISRRIKPVATLFHWDLPQALEDEGGWTNRATAYAFADYARIVASEFGDDVDTWGTLNEPWCTAFLGYGIGIFAPGIRDRESSLRAAHHLNLAHGLGVQILRALIPANKKVSITLNLVTLRADGDTGAEAVRRIDAVANRIFTSPQLLGEYPTDLIADTAGVTDWSFVLEGDLETIHQPIDYLGFNYYHPTLVRLWDEEGERESTGPLLSTEATVYPGAAEQVDIVRIPGPRTEYDWVVDANGLEELILSLQRQFPDQEILLTENGAAFADEVVVEDGVARVHDAERISYLREHLGAALRAINKGAKLRGYFVWSLMDNFEWAAGYHLRFGMIRIDYNTLERIPKDSAHWYASFLKRRTNLNN